MLSDNAICLCAHCHANEGECLCDKPRLKLFGLKLMKHKRTYCKGCQFCSYWHMTPYAQHLAQRTMRLQLAYDSMLFTGVGLFLAAVMLLFLLPGCADPSDDCGFEGKAFEATITPVDGCPPEPRTLISFSDSAVPEMCTQDIMYDHCTAIVARQCSNGARALWVLSSESGMYSGPLQVTLPDLRCRYEVELTQQ